MLDYFITTDGAHFPQELLLVARAGRTCFREADCSRRKKINLGLCTSPGKKEGNPQAAVEVGCLQECQRCWKEGGSVAGCAVISFVLPAELHGLLTLQHKKKEECKSFKVEVFASLADHVFVASAAKHLICSSLAFGTCDGCSTSCRDLLFSLVKVAFCAFSASCRICCTLLFLKCTSWKHW